MGLLYHFEECIDRYVVHVRTFAKERVPARLDRFFFNRTQRTRKQGVWRCCSSVAGGWRHGVRRSHRSRCLACCNWPASCPHNIHGNVEAVMHSLHPRFLLCRVHGPIDQPSAIPNTIQLMLVLGLLRVERLGVASRTVIRQPVHHAVCPSNRTRGWGEHGGSMQEQTVGQYVDISMSGVCALRGSMHCFSPPMHHHNAFCLTPSDGWTARSTLGRATLSVREGASSFEAYMHQTASHTSRKIQEEDEVG